MENESQPHGHVTEAAKTVKKMFAAAREDYRLTAIEAVFAPDAFPNAAEYLRSQFPGVTVEVTAGPEWATTSRLVAKYRYRDGSDHETAWLMRTPMRNFGRAA